MTTERMILTEDEDGETLHLHHAEASIADDEAQDYGIDIPSELVAQYERINEDWAAYQKGLKQWFDRWLPDDEARAERVRSVVLEHYRTWDQLDALASCSHTAAWGSVKATKRPTHCELCGSYVHYLHARTPAGEWKSTGEIGVMR